jgi:hypothetical protein
MKRMLIAAATSSMLALAAPGLASAAHKSKCHHHAHHACAKSRHATHARVLTFGRPSSTTSNPAAPTVPGAPAAAGETAGTVASFTGGVLTITLKDGSSVAGKVTETTEIRCQSSTPTSQEGDDDQNGDEASGGNGDDGSSHGGGVFGSHGDDMSSGDDGQEDGQGQSSACTTAALVPTAVVSEAELSIGASGAVWDHVDLIS